MKPRTTLILAILAGGIFSYIYFVERHAPTTQEQSEAAAKVVSIEQSKITGITILNADSKVELRKQNESWSLQTPVSDRADSSTVSQLLGLVDSLRHSSKIEIPTNQSAEKLKEFGVAESDLRLKLQSEGGKETELLLGKDSAVEGKLYIRVQGANAVYVVAQTLRTQLTRKADEFRDKKLSDLPLQQIQKFTVQTADGELELERKNNHWDIVKPMRARAADQKVNDLLANIINAQVSQFLPEQPAPEQGLAEPRATITLHREGQSEPITLKVGAAPSGDENKEKSFARLSSRAAVTVLANSSLNPLLQARPNDVRDRKLVRVESDIVDRITIQSEGKPEIVLARKGESWIRRNGDQEVKINESLATKLLSSIQGAEVTQFVSDVASDLEKHGLAKPHARITLSSFASANTAETKAGEKPIATILIGGVEGEGVFAKLEEEPFIVAVPKSLRDLIPSHASQLQPLGLLDLKPEAFTSIEVSQDSGVEKLEKKDGAWTVAAGEGKVSDGSILTLTKTLASLQAQRWVSPEEAGEKAEEKPTLTLQASYKEGDKVSTFTLTVGRALGEEGFFAKIAGKEGSFLLTKANKDDLATKLIIK
ncbi:MAG: hypothetical protein RLZZ244_3025 [Verrucomicrobiota bacterium]